MAAEQESVRIQVRVEGGELDVELLGGAGGTDNAGTDDGAGAPPRSGAADDAGLPGSPRPVLVVQTALEAEELRPLAGLLADGGCRVAYMLRAGYGQAGSPPPRGSAELDAADCAAVAAALGWEPLHVVGGSYSSAVALSWAAARPESVASLSLLEAPPTHTGAGERLRALTEELRAVSAESGTGEALDAFMRHVMGPDWRAAREAMTSGSVEALERDTPAFIDGDLPAVLGWRFGPEEAARVRCPVLYVEGEDSGPLFAQVGAWLESLVPQTQRRSIPGAGHDLGLTHTSESAALVLGFLEGLTTPG